MNQRLGAEDKTMKHKCHRCHQPAPFVYCTETCDACYSAALAAAIAAKRDAENEARFMREAAAADENACYGPETA